MTPAAPRRRRPSGGRLTSGRWQKLRARVIREEPLCRLTPKVTGKSAVAKRRQVFPVERLVGLGDAP